MGRVSCLLDYRFLTNIHIFHFGLLKSLLTARAFPSVILRHWIRYSDQLYIIIVFIICCIELIIKVKAINVQIDPPFLIQKGFSNWSSATIREGYSGWFERRQTMLTESFLFFMKSSIWLRTYPEFFFHKISPQNKLLKIGDFFNFKSLQLLQFQN